MHTPRVTIAMTAYNTERYIGSAIESVLAQTCADFELLVVNDHSDDATHAIAQSYAVQDTRVRVINAPEKGRVPALNQVLAEARSPWFAVFDSDDVALPEKFAKQMAFLAANPDHGIVGCDNSVIGPDGAPILRPAINRPLSHESLTRDMEAGIMLLHSTMIARTDLVRQVGGYRAPFRFSQDYDLYLRLARLTRMANLPDKLVLYRIYPEQVSTMHLVAQTLSAVVAWLSHRAREEGVSDPLEGMATLPPLGTLDALFGITGADACARDKIVARIIHSPETLVGDGYRLLLDHIGERGANAALWRAAARLLKAGYPRQAARVGLALAAA